MSDDDATMDDTNVIMFKVEITATGEVRDKDGNLISSTPLQTEVEMTGEQLDALGLPHPPHPQEM